MYCTYEVTIKICLQEFTALQIEVRENYFLKFQELRVYINTYLSNTVHS